MPPGEGQIPSLTVPITLGRDPQSTLHLNSKESSICQTCSAPKADYHGYQSVGLFSWLERAGHLGRLCQGCLLQFSQQENHLPDGFEPGQCLLALACVTTNPGIPSVAVCCSRLGLEPARHLPAANPNDRAFLDCPLGLDGPCSALGWQLLGLSS